MDYRFEQHEAAVQSGKWIGDNIPSFHGNLGPEILATLYGAELEFTRDSSWCQPMCHSSRQVLNLQPDLDTPLLEVGARVGETFAGAGQGQVDHLHHRSAHPCRFAGGAA